jgi:tetratricopeptide (TPR) repeat protein
VRRPGDVIAVNRATRQRHVATSPLLPILPGYGRPVGSPSVARVADPGWPLVGRRDELRALDAWWGAAHRGEQPALALVQGAAGAGKTRLVTAFADARRHDGVHVLAGAATDHDRLAHEPWASAVRGFLSGAPAAIRTTAVDEHAGEVAAIPWLRDLVDAPYPLRGAPGPGAVASAVVGILARLTRSAPVLVVVDDVHWCGRAATDVLHRVLDARLPGLAVVTTERWPIPRGPWHDARAVRSHPTVGVHLEGLDVDACRELLAARHPPPVDEPVVEAVHQASGGNAFVAITLLELVVRSPLPPAAVVERLPATAEALWAARFSPLTPGSRRVLSIAAVAGTTCPAAWLDAATGDPAMAAAAVAEGLDTGVLRPTDGSTIAFTHALLREHLVASLSLTRRRRIHRRLAKTIPSTGPSTVSARLAFHHAESGPTASRATLVHLVDAAWWAFGEGATEDALTHAEDALDLLDTQPLEPHDTDGTESRLGDLLLRLGHPRGLPLMLALAEHHRASGDHDAAARVVEALLRAQELLAPDPAAIDLAERVLVHLDRGEDGLRSRVLARLCRALDARPGAQARRAQWSAEALALARADGRPATIALALLCAATVRPWTDDRLHQLEELVALGRRLDDVELLVTGLAYLLVFQLAAGDVDGARASFAEAERLANDIPRGYAGVLRNGDLRREALALVALRRAVLAQWTGDAEARTRALEAVRPLADDPGIDRASAYELLVAQSYLFEYDHGDPAALTDLVVAFHAEAPDEVHRRIGAAFALALAGHHDRARDLVGPLVDRDLEDLPIDQATSPMLVLLAWIAWWLDWERLATLVDDRLAPFAGRHAVYLGGTFGPVDLSLGLLAWTVGRHDDARRWIDRAVAACTEVGARPWVARTRLIRARLLLALGDPLAALDDADAAVTAAAELSMPTVLADAHRVRRRASSGRP